MLEDFRDDTLCKWREWSRNEELSHDIGDKNWLIYQSIHPSIKINFWQMEGGKALCLKTNHPALSLPVNASQILTMNVVNRNTQYIDEKDRPFSSHWNKAGVKKVICEAKPIKSAFALILQQFHSDFFFSFEWQSWQNANKFNVPCTTWSPENISRKWWWFSKLVKKGRVILALIHSTISSCLLELFMCVLQFLNWEHQRYLCHLEVKDLVGHSRRMLTRASGSGWRNMSNPLHKSQGLRCQMHLDIKMYLATF